MLLTVSSPYPLGANFFEGGEVVAVTGGVLLVVGGVETPASKFHYIVALNGLIRFQKKPQNQ